MEQKALDRKKLIEFFISRNILLSPDIIDYMASLTDFSEIYALIKKNIGEEEFMILSKDIHSLLKSQTPLDANWVEFDKSRSRYEKKREGRAYSRFMDYLRGEGTGQKKSVPVALQAESGQESTGKEQDRQPSPSEDSFNFRIVNNFSSEQKKKREIQDFVSHFNVRFQQLERMLAARPDLVNLMSIQRLKSKRERDTVSIIGMVLDKRTTKNNNIIIELEDPTGTINVLVNQNKPELFEQAKEIVLDEIIGVVGQNGDNILFANTILWPDIPMAGGIKKAREEAYALFLSDLHVGSKTFMADEFARFIKWIRGEIGNEAQQRIARLSKYIFIVGDLVDGVGIYPNQDSDLEITDIYEQYRLCGELLSGIPPDKLIVVCPGNHDAMRLAEPQMTIYRDIAEPLFRLPNLKVISNPGLVNIHAGKDFPGFDVLLYHGYSFDYYVREVESIRNSGGYDEPEAIMKFLLKRRHLAPSHTSTLYSPDEKLDALLIDRIPDFFLSGHIHKCSVSSYRNVTMVCGSCWQSKTSFQEKVGLKPEPCRVPIVNLKTREMKIMKFGD